MAILVSSIVARCQAQLDSENSDYFLFQQDFAPAINSAQDWLVGVINSQLGVKKFSEEIFQDITLARIFQTSTFSRVRLDPAVLGHSVWTILTVEPMCVTTPAFSPSVLPNPQDSAYRSDLTQVNSEFYATRKTAEEWAKNYGNPFDSSHTLDVGETAKAFGYLNYTDYTSGGYTLTAPKQEVEIRPHIVSSPVCIRYVRTPVAIAATTDSVEFPAFCMDYIVSATCLFLGVKIGDNTTLESLSERFLAVLIGATK